MLSDDEGGSRGESKINYRNAPDSHSVVTNTLFGTKEYAVGIHKD